MITTLQVTFLRRFKSNMYSLILITLQHIINTTWQQDDRGPDKLSRWIRCLFSLAVSETDIAVQLLDQAVTVAEEARKVCNFTSSRRSLDASAHYLPRPCSSPCRIHRKSSNGLQQRPLIAQLTSIVFRKTRRAGFGLRRH